VPYITDGERQSVEPELNRLRMCMADITPGKLNYVITKLITAFVGIPSYTRYNAAIGVLECVKLELYRRQVVGYEDLKCHENGDVY
jgi:hypothetical protein